MNTGALLALLTGCEGACLQGVDVEDDDAGGPSPRQRDARQNARQRDRRRHIALRLDLFFFVVLSFSH